MRKIKKYIIVFIVVIIAISLILLKIRLNNLDNNNIEPIYNDELLEKKEEDKKKETKTEEVKKVSVDIKGAVNNPGVYELDSDKKVIDVVNLAGGLSDNADTSIINLAKKVSDEMVVIIYTDEEIKEATKNNNNIIKPIDTVCKCPEIKNDACLNTKTKENNNTSKNEKESSNDNNIASNNGKSELVNINTASMEELTKVNGIGDSKAKAIIEYREEVGKFNTIEDIKKVTGIGETLYNKIKDYITV